MNEEQMTTIDWDKAKEHFDEARQQYVDLLGQPRVNTALASLMIFDPLLTRYNDGERTEELYAAMMAVE